MVQHKVSDAQGVWMAGAGGGEARHEYGVAWDGCCQVEKDV